MLTKCGITWAIFSIQSLRNFISGFYCKMHFSKINNVILHFLILCPSNWDHSVDELYGRAVSSLTLYPYVPDSKHFLWNEQKTNFTHYFLMFYPVSVYIMIKLHINVFVFRLSCWWNACSNMRYCHGTKTLFQTTCLSQPRELSALRGSQTTHFMISYYSWLSSSIGKTVLVSIIE